MTRQELFTWIRQQYGTEPEYPWHDWNAVLRHNDNNKWNALAESQFVRVWKYIAVRSTEERCYYTYVNGQKIKHVVKPKLGEHQPNNPKLVYTMDFQVTPHQLRHTYITNLIYASVDPKTVQYLAGHENSKVTMDIYAKVKYNKPAQLHGVINRAIDTSKKD